MATTIASRGTFAAEAQHGSSMWDLLMAITLRDLRVKYRATFLSYFWWIARPLTLGLVMYFALDRVLALDIPNQAAFLLSALFPWFWFQSTLIDSTGAFIGNAGLVKKVRFTRIVVPLSVVAGSTIEFIVTLPVLVLLVIISGIEPSWAWIAGIPVLMAVQLALLCGLGVAAACINVFVRDLQPGLMAFTTLLFYVSPIIYPLDRVPDGYERWLRLNPLVPLLDGWREVLVDGSMPGFALWPSVVFAVVAVAAGLWTMHAADRSLADAL